MKRLTRALCSSAAEDFAAKNLLPKGIFLRAADINDLDAVMGVGLACFDSDEPERHKIRHFLTEAHAVIAALCDGDKMIGYLHLEAHALRRNIYLNTVALLDAYRGKGLGNILYLFADFLAQKTGAGSIWSHVDAKDKRAVHMLQKNGYIIERTEDPYYDDGRAAYIMRKVMAA
jgi:ribosomal protein S18 acetylase RimI-like enzyme